MGMLQHLKDKHSGGTARHYQGCTAVSLFITVFLLVLVSFRPAHALTDDEIIDGYSRTTDMALGGRIAFWAARFIGTPYDPDPLGEYVRKRVIVADERIDCMYHVFRSVELAKGNSPEGAVLYALDLRFHSKGILENGLVANYNERFRYGEDMVRSGKWGQDITASLGKTFRVRDPKGGRPLNALRPDELHSRRHLLKDGDILFLVKSPKKRKTDEVVGHMGIVAGNGGPAKGTAYFIHAGGTKGGRGMVRKDLLSDYLRAMPFNGITVTRFQ